MKTRMESTKTMMTKYSTLETLTFSKDVVGEGRHTKMEDQGWISHNSLPTGSESSLAPSAAIPYGLPYLLACNNHYQCPCCRHAKRRMSESSIVCHKGFMSLRQRLGMVRYDEFWSLRMTDFRISFRRSSLDRYTVVGWMVHTSVIDS